MQEHRTIASSTPINPAPAFQFYPGDFLADQRVAQMDNRELGVYLRLLCYCWREGSLPKDLKALAKLCHEPLAAMRKIMVQVAPCFAPDPTQPERLIHLGLQQELLKQEQHRQAASERGQKGAASRWEKTTAPSARPARRQEKPVPEVNEVNEVHPAHRTPHANACAMPKHSSSSSSPSSQKKEMKKNTPIAPDGGQWGSSEPDQDWQPQPAIYPEPAYVAFERYLAEKEAACAQAAYEELAF